MGIGCSLKIKIQFFACLQAIEQIKLFSAETNSFDALKLSYAVCDYDFVIEKNLSLIEKNKH
jgi:hypothetical protein